MKLVKFRYLSLALSSFLALVAVLPQTASGEDVALPQVLVSVPTQAYFVKRLAGDAVKVETIIPVGVTEETYEPGLAQAQRLKDSALYLKVGHPLLFLEKTWLENLKRLSPNLAVVDSIAGASVVADDPHVWLSPAIMKIMVNNFAVALKKLVSEQAATIDANLETIQNEIADTETFLNDLFKDSGGCSFLVFHPSWGYFARAFNLNQLAVEAEGKMPTPGGLARVITQAKYLEVKSVFIHPGESHDSANIVASELAAQVVTIDPLAENWIENMRSVGVNIKSGLGRQVKLDE